jgi:hypothetical protein
MPETAIPGVNDMRVIAAILASGLTAAATAAAAGTPCALASVRSCADTNQLVWSTSFQPALQTFLGNRAVSWLGQKAEIADVVSEVLGGPPDAPVEVAEGLIRFSAVRPQSATERGAVFIAADGTIKAAGVLHFNCAQRCDKSYSLTMLMTSEDKALMRLVLAWGIEQMQSNEANGLDKDLTTIGRVEVLTPGH